MVTSFSAEQGGLTALRVHVKFLLLLLTKEGKVDSEIGGVHLQWLMLNLSILIIFVLYYVLELV